MDTKKELTDVEFLRAIADGYDANIPQQLAAANRLHKIAGMIDSWQRVFNAQDECMKMTGTDEE